jgi:hypothetical protein
MAVVANPPWLTKRDLRRTKGFAEKLRMYLYAAAACHPEGVVALVTGDTGQPILKFIL